MSSNTDTSQRSLKFNRLQDGQATPRQHVVVLNWYLEKVSGPLLYIKQNKHHTQTKLSTQLSFNKQDSELRGGPLFKTSCHCQFLSDTLYVVKNNLLSYQAPNRSLFSTEVLEHTEAKPRQAKHITTRTLLEKA